MQEPIDYRVGENQEDQDVAVKRLMAALAAVVQGDQVITDLQVSVPVVEITEDGDEARKYATTGATTWTFTVEPAEGQHRFRQQ